MIRVAVIGGRGQLGSELVAVLQNFGHNAISLTREDLDVTDPDSVQRALAAARPDAVVNCAAFVRVDECEDRADEAFRVNAIGARHVARNCAELGAKCVYVSTDYVFDGRKKEPYTEEDCPRPINVYGASKLAGEYLTQHSCNDWLIVRTASLFGKVGARGKDSNFVETILTKVRAGETLRVVSDIRVSPTYALDAATMIGRLVGLGATGIFHVANSGACTWYEFASRIVRITNAEVSAVPIPTSALPTKASRPANSALDGSKLVELLGEQPRSWDLALQAYLQEKRHVRRADVSAP